MAISTAQRNFINMIGKFARQNYDAGKLILPSVCIAQACCESGYGTTRKMTDANAVFGIKVGKSAYKFGDAWKGAAYSTKTREVINGDSIYITDLFRAYDSIEDSVTDYYDMLCHASRYKKAVGAKTPEATITAIKEGGYATDPNYISLILSIIKSQRLTEFDPGGVVILENTYPKLVNFTGSSIEKALQAVGETDYKYPHRKEIYTKNFGAGYTGTSAQNLLMIKYLKSGLLLKA